MKCKFYMFAIMLFMYQQGYAKVTCVRVNTKDMNDVIKSGMVLNCIKDEILYECVTSLDYKQGDEVLYKDLCIKFKARCRDTRVLPTTDNKNNGELQVSKADNVGKEMLLKKTFCILDKYIDPRVNPDARKLIVYLEAAKGFNYKSKEDNSGDNTYIFEGKTMECSENLLNYKNCCGVSGSGWCEGWFASCDADEKELAQKRDAGLAVSIGDYCHNRLSTPLNVCTSRHHVYCVFPSKVGRVIQEQGRRRQLQVGFGNIRGDSSNPDCRGLTMEELWKIRYDLIDYSEIDQELSNNKLFYLWEEIDCYEP